MTKQIDDAHLVRLCGLWHHESRAGPEYLTGTLFLRQDDPQGDGA
jgi:hypothetical protein